MAKPRKHKRINEVFFISTPHAEWRFWKKRSQVRIIAGNLPCL